MATNLRKYTTQEVLNKVYEDASGNTIGINAATAKETLNAALDEANSRLNVSLAGGTISGDVTITGDLTVSGGGSTFAYNEVVTGDMFINRDASGVGAENGVGLYVDFDRTVAASGTAAHNDIGINLDITSASLGVSSVIGMDIDVVGATSGTSTATGLTVDVGSADTNYAALFNGGNVGIGTASPSHAMEIVSGATDYQQIKLTNTDTDNTVQRMGIVGQEYNAEYDPIGIIGCYSTTTLSWVGIGGTSADSNANQPKEIRFFTQADTGNTTAGAQRMTINGSGSVGIGNTSPGSFDSEANNLVVGSGVGDNGITIFTGSSAGHHGSIFFGDATGTPKQGQIRYEQNNEVMSFFTNTAERMRIDISGKVGIGKTPEHELDINSTGVTTLNLESTANYDTPPTVIINATLEYNSSGASTEMGQILWGKNNDTDTNTGGYLALYNKPAGGSLAEAMRIDPDGNVGIGVTDPNNQLMVGSLTGGGISVARTDTSINDGDSLGTIQFKGKDDGGGGIYGIGAKITALATETWNEATAEGTSLNFYTTDNATATNDLRMTIDENGNVGIGTASPATLVEIQGGLTTVGAVLTLSTKETTVVTNDVLGQINFQAPLSSAGTDAILPGASISAVAGDTFAAANNETDLVFSTASSDAEFGSATSGALYEHMRITSNGVVEINKNVSVSNHAVFIYNDHANGYCTHFESQGNNTNRLGIRIRCGSDGAAGVGTSAVFHSGDGTLQGSITFNNQVMSLNNGSDYRLKNNIVDAYGSLDKIKRLKVRNFNYNGSDVVEIGFIAHELMEEIPRAVKGTKDEINENGEPVYQGVDPRQIVPDLTLAVQEQNALIEALTARIVALEA